MKKEDFFKNWERIIPKPIAGEKKVGELVSEYFTAYNASRIREICYLLEKKVMREDVVVGMTLAGALTPAGLGLSCIIPLIKQGLVDWIVSTGANIYHDLHFTLNLPLYKGRPFVNDVELLNQNIIRIYDVFTSYETLNKTDRWLIKTLSKKEFQKSMGSAELHNKLGKYAAMKEKELGLEDASILACAYRYGVPIFTSSPGDSTVGMGIAALKLVGSRIEISTVKDVNETSAIVYYAKEKVGRSAVIIWGGGSPKNFILQTEPYIQEILGLPVLGHDYFIQVTDARPDTGGLSGATPQEAVSWSKINPKMLPDAIVCYSDTTIVMPIVVSYLSEKNIKRPHKRLYSKLNILSKNLERDFLKLSGDKKSDRGNTSTIQFLQKIRKK